MRNEKGSILVETTMAILLCLVFLYGVTRLHGSWKKRHQAILEHRNREIEKLRVEKTKLLPAAGLPRFSDVGISFPEQ